MPNETAEFIPTRESLLSRLKDWNDRESWKDFFDTYWKLIYRTAIQSGLSDAEAQDVVQETILSVARVMPDFKYEASTGSFKRWLLRLTSWRITDQIRKRRPGDGLVRRRAQDTAATTAVERVPDPAAKTMIALWDAEWERNILEAALDRVKRQVDPKQYQMFDFNVLEEWPVKKVANTLRVSAAAVYVAKHRISALVKKEIKRLRGEPPRLGGRRETKDHEK